MKKQSFLIMAGAILAFASCKNENSQGGFNQAQVDSMVSARVETLRVEMMRQNDSTINSLSAIRADSIINAMKGGNSTTSKTVHVVKSHVPDPTSVTTRLGATNHMGTKVTDRPGATTNSNDTKPKSVSDRPGATSTNR